MRKFDGIAFTRLSIRDNASQVVVKLSGELVFNVENFVVIGSVVMATIQAFHLANKSVAVCIHCRGKLARLSIGSRHWRCVESSKSAGIVHR